jgi:hypothetical protein
MPPAAKKTRSGKPLKPEKGKRAKWSGVLPTDLAARPKRQR